MSHGLGARPKNIGEIMEIVIFDHMLWCLNEEVKVVVSDNAYIGKRWLITAKKLH